jgi:hypothetical protein
MDKNPTNDIQGQIPQVVRSLDKLAREWARRMVAEALEVEEYIQRLRHLRDENGHALQEEILCRIASDRYCVPPNSQKTPPNSPTARRA